MQISQEREDQFSKPMNLLEINREFNVPVDQLFNAFTTSEALKSWWWPKGLYSDHIEIDFIENGRYFINMKGDQSGSGMTGYFEEIVENERIAMTDQFANEKGHPISAAEAKMSGEWPEKGYITFDFEPIDAYRSSLKLSQEGIPNEMREECIRGWNEMFDKLEKYLS